MADAPIFGFNCTNNDCGKLFKMRYPGKAGYFKVSCPHCGSKVTVKMPSPEVVSASLGKHESEPAVEDMTGKPPVSPGYNEGQQQSDKNIPDSSGQPVAGNDKKSESDRKVSPEIDNSGKPIIDYADYPEGNPYFTVGERVIITCPHCHTRKLGYTAKKEGMPTFTCPGCKGKIRVWFQRPTVIIDSEKFNSRQAKIVHVRPLWLSTSYPLPPGEHTIGRFDHDKPSTISIKGDSSMSRRSISITASISPNEGFRYRMRVLSATNPVMHAGRALTEGEEVYLNFGDEIRLGNSLFRFLEDEKAPKFNNF